VTLSAQVARSPEQWQLCGGSPVWSGILGAATLANGAATLANGATNVGQRSPVGATAALFDRVSESSHSLAAAGGREFPSLNGREFFERRSRPEPDIRCPKLTAGKRTLKLR
jgi:hypothetical protein